jgi:purine-binding chemotaxis protein CheW
MGLLPVKECNMRIVDTARVVMPERYDEAMRSGYRYVITLNGSDWGLAVDQVANAVRLDPEQVRWRGQRSQRPWLAGTVVAHMCALLDAAQLAWMFHNQDRKRRARRPR